MVHLICTLEPARINLLPQFIAHYVQLGVQLFHFSIHFEPGLERPGMMRSIQEAEKALEPFSLTLSAVLVCPFSALALREHHDRLQTQHCRNEDWVMWADIDEFHVFPEDFHGLLQFAETARIDYFWGEFVDRVAADGSLKAFDPAQCIWSQYPRKCHITRDVARAHTGKVTCARASVRISPGNHYVLNAERLRYYKPRVEVHHFKWDDSVMRRLGRRLLPDWREQWPWWIESKKIVDFLEQSGGSIADFS